MYGQFVAMPNVLAGRELVPELLQDAATPAALADALIAQLSASGARADVLAEFRRLHRALRCDGSARAAEAVLALLQATRIT
jgi:lipid-A-disaccharide synthase